MRQAAFTTPRLLGHHGNDVRPSSDIGSTNQRLWPGEAGTSDLDYLLRHCSGLMRGLTLSGYRVVEVFVEENPISANDRLLLDTATLGVGTVPTAPDELDAARSGGAPLLVGLTIDPLWPFEDPGGPPLAIELDDAALSGAPGAEGVVSSLHPDRRGWLGFSCEDATLWPAVQSISPRAEALARVLADALQAAWFRDPAPLGPPAGLGWMLDTRNWWYPPMGPDPLDEDARQVAAGFGAASLALSTGDADLADFLTDQVVRTQDTHLLNQAGSFGRLTREWASQTPDGVVAAYLARVSGLADGTPEAARIAAEDLDRRYLWVDAAFTMLQHGAAGILHHLVPGHPETASSVAGVGASTPEWTRPALTGQWDGTDTFDTIILNQAGTRVSGFWQRRVGNPGQGLHRYTLDGTMTGGDRDGGPLVFDVKIWDQPGNDPLLNDEDELGPPRALGSLTVGQPAVGPTELTLVADVDGVSTRELARSRRGPQAHHTRWTLTGLPRPVQDALRAERDAPLHLDETSVVTYLLEAVVRYVDAFIADEPTATQLLTLVDEFFQEVQAQAGAFVRDPDLMPTVRRLLLGVLGSTRAVGGDSYWDLLQAMLRLTFSSAPSEYLQDVFGLRVVTDPDDVFRYRWRLRDIRMGGLGLGVSRTSGTGTFELQRVDDDGNPLGPVIARTIDLRNTDVGTVLELPSGPEDVASFGPGDLTEWNTFLPTHRDITTALDGAEFSMMSFGAEFLVLESSSTAEVWLQPSDDQPPLNGRVEGELLKVMDLNPFADDAAIEDTLDRTKRGNDLRKKGKDVLEELLKNGAKAGAKKLLTSVTLKTSYLEGWLRTAEDESRAPDPEPVPADAYVTSANAWARFDTDAYELTPEFRDRVRSFAMWNLPLLTRLGDLRIEGNASPLASTEDYNVRLSRDRAMSVLTALVDVLGPQLAVPIGSVTIHGYGSSRSTGAPDSDAEWDRRVDVVLGGQVRFQS